MYITNDNEIFIYFEVVDQIEPQTILDVDFFLQRAGAVAREIKGCSLEEEVQIIGLTHNGKVLPIYQTIYNQIIESPDSEYDLGVLLGMENDKYVEAFTQIKNFCKSILIDDMEEIRNIIPAEFNIKELTVENSKYLLLFR